MLKRFDLKVLVSFWLLGAVCALDFPNFFPAHHYSDKFQADIYDGLKLLAQILIGTHFFVCGLMMSSYVRQVRTKQAEALAGGACRKTLPRVSPWGVLETLIYPYPRMYFSGAQSP